MTLATVKVFPEPVTPRSTWSRTPALVPSTSCRMASGWSPCGSKEETSLNRLMDGSPERRRPAGWRRAVPARAGGGTPPIQPPGRRRSDTLSLFVGRAQRLDQRLRLLGRDSLVHARVAQFLQERLEPRQLRVAGRHARAELLELRIEFGPLRGRNVLGELPVGLALHRSEQPPDETSAAIARDHRAGDGEDDQERQRGRAAAARQRARNERRLPLRRGVVLGRKRERKARRGRWRRLGSGRRIGHRFVPGKKWIMSPAWQVWSRITPSLSLAH